MLPRFRYAIGRFGVRPSLIEWDNEIPPLATLLEQAARADEITAEITLAETRCARAR